MFRLHFQELNLQAVSNMPHAIIPRILFIDAYDSFTNNIISLLESELAVEVTAIKIDDQIDDFVEFLEPFAAVIAGPGPGHPRNINDVGLFDKLWILDHDHATPVLGICLGFQSLVQAFGGRVQPLPEPRHGIIRKIHHADTSFFRGAGNIETVQYHSLHATLNHSYDSRLSSPELWKSTESCPDLRPLAWDLESDNSPSQNEALPTKNPNSILMAVEHTTKPFCGIQFHPESICSNKNAQKIISTWWGEARKWKQIASSVETFQNKRSMAIIKTVHTSLLIENETEQSVPKLLNRPKCGESNYLAPITRNIIPTQKNDPNTRRELLQFGYNSSLPPLQVSTKVRDLGPLKLPQICESLGVNKGEAIVFDSEGYQRSEIGVHSILGLLTPSSLKLEYTVGSCWVRQIQEGKVQYINLQEFGGQIFTYLKHFMKKHQTDGGNPTVPFWGGLMGYITYEACLETIHVHPTSNVSSQTNQTTARPDLSFVFIERSIVINFPQKKLYIQSIKPNDSYWVSETESLLLRCQLSSTASISPNSSFQAQIFRPNEVEYKSKIRDCQTSIRAGDAYEICLTTNATIKTSRDLSAWSLYRRLRCLNPSPFCAYLHLGPLTLLSSSPERFLNWSRPFQKAPSFTPTTMTTSRALNEIYPKISTCQFRPIKGTVKRIPKDSNLPPVTLAEAITLLSTSKERAENLMIVDLIRHDLHGVVGSGNVRVKKLMVVEEYATLFQLVTVIEGDLQVDEDEDKNESSAPMNSTSEPYHEACPTTFGECPRKPPRNNKTGIDVLAASLPPGSMTGAPKKRACQILQALEPHPRGVYSGVLGYLDVGGGGDFSVVIRSAFKWDDDPDDKRAPCTGNGEEEEGAAGEEMSQGGDTWKVGAGGAVTILSSEEGEWEEMGVKMGSTMEVFRREEK